VRGARGTATVGLGVALADSSDVATLNRTHSLKYVKGGLCQNESRKTENIYGRI